jgi:hypothetical protein
MAIHVVVNPDVITGSTFETAFMEVSGEPASANVTFTVFPIGLPAQTAVVPMNASNFAKSPNLFGMSSNRTALVMARTVDPATPSNAVLRQNMGGGVREALTVPSSNVNMGRSFNIPIGDLTGGGNLYVGNPNLVPSVVQLRYGNSGAPALPGGTVPATSALKIPIAPTPIDTNLIVTIVSDEPVVCQAVIGTRFMIVYPIISGA